MKIKQTKITKGVNERLNKGFAEYDFSKLGLKDLICVVQVIYGQLYITELLIDEGHRGQGFGTKLMNHAFKYGKEKGCDFVCIATMDFQAPEFYKKHGFTVEFIRSGFVKGSKRYHMRKDLN